MQQDPAFQEKLKSMSVQGAYLNAADYEKYVKEETELFTKIVKDKGLIK